MANLVKLYHNRLVMNCMDCGMCMVYKADTFFNVDYVKAVCHLCNNRTIIGMVVPEVVREYTTIPSWCPMKDYKDYLQIIKEVRAIVWRT